MPKQHCGSGPALALNESQGAPPGRTGSGPLPRPSGGAGDQEQAEAIYTQYKLCGETDSGVFALRIIPSNMVNCRLPNLAGKAAPKGEQSRGRSRAGKRSAVRGAQQAGR